jgi:hypothetical protein
MFFSMEGTKKRLDLMGLGASFSKKMLAATYSPGELPHKYHRRRKA